MNDQLLSYEECRVWAERYGSTPWNMLALSTVVDKQPSALAVLRSLLAECERLQGEIAHYRRSLTAHHDIGTLSDEVLREYDFRACPVCARAQE